MSCGGTWQQRGFASRNGVTTVITHSHGKTGKVVDIEVLTNYCSVCAASKGDALKHECMKNHSGSAGAMESVQKRMGKRLMEKIKPCKGEVYTWKGRKTKEIGGHGKLHAKATSCSKVIMGIILEPMLDI